VRHPGNSPDKNNEDGEWNGEAGKFRIGMDKSVTYYSSCWLSMAHSFVYRQDGFELSLVIENKDIQIWCFVLLVPHKMCIFAAYLFFNNPLKKA
jgi:hypothetical protein